MSDHSTAIVPLETWAYMSPELRKSGKSIDVGLFAEALLYYDRVLVIPTNENHFIEFIGWFIKNGKFDDLLVLLRENIINFYIYAFISSVAQLENGKIAALNIQDEEQSKTNIFEKRFLNTKRLEEVVTQSHQRARLYRDISARVIEVKAEDFGAEIYNAQEDYQNPKNAAMLVQAFIDDVYPSLGISEIPEISASVVKKGEDHVITWNINFDEVSKTTGKEIGFRPTTPLIAGIHSNRLLWSAAQMNCDLYSPSPISTLIGNKLLESSGKLTQGHVIIDQLNKDVEFPNIRSLVNEGIIGLNEVLEIRKKSKLFRNWLQDESERDRNAIIAYHSEVARETGWTRGNRKILRIFGSIGGSILGAATGVMISGTEGLVQGAVVGTITSEGTKFLLDLANKYKDNWHPVVFGKWMEEKIKRTSL